MYKILVIDDEPQIRKGIKTIIERGQGECVQVFQAENGNEGMDVILEEKPEIVITDIRMPVMDGLEMIKNINSRLASPPQFIVLSGYDDFTYAKTAMKYGVKEYLLKPVRRDELNSLLDSFREVIDENRALHKSKHLQYIQNKEGMNAIKEKFFNILMTSSKEYEKKRVLNDLRTLGIAIEDGPMTVMVMDYRSRSGKIRTEFVKLDRFALRNVIEEILFNQNLNFIDFFDDEQRMVLALWHQDVVHLRDMVFDLNVKISGCLNKYLDLDIYTGVSCDVGNLMSLEKAYYEALSNVKSKLTRDGEQIAFEVHKKSDPSVTSEINEFTAAIKRDTEFCRNYQVAALVNELFDYLRKKEASYNDYQLVYKRLVVDLMEYFDQKRINVFEQTDEENRVKAFDSFWTTESFQNYINKHLFNISNAIYRKREFMTNVQLIDQIIEYLDEHYSQNINLNSVSAMFNKTNSYISTVFKRETNKNFLNYLTDLRIDKAKELLNDSTIKIKDVGTQVGYINPKHFNVVFKKTVGMTPRAYRNQVLQSRKY